MIEIVLCRLIERPGFSDRSCMTKMDDGDHSMRMTGQDGRPQTCPVTDWETVKAQVGWTLLDQLKRQLSGDRHLILSCFLSPFFVCVYGGQ